ALARFLRNAAFQLRCCACNGREHWCTGRLHERACEYPRIVPPALITVFPDPIVFQIPDTVVRIGWYGVGYVGAATVMLLTPQREGARRGIEPKHVWNALIIVAVCALIGARLYHVIDQWGSCSGGPCYSQNLPAIVLPPYSGLALYGGLFGGLVG